MTFPSIDLRAVILLAGALGALMSFVLYFLRRSYPPTIHGLGCWALGPVLTFVSTLFFGMRGMAPEFLTVVIANLLLMSGLLLLYQGSRHFYGQPPSWRPWLLSLAAAMGGIGWFTHVQPHYNARLVLVTAYLAFLFLRHALLLRRLGQPSFAVRFTSVILLIESAILTLRAFSAFTVDAQGLLDATPIQTIYIAAYSVVMVMLLVGLILMASDRLRAEMEHLATHDPLTGILTRRALIKACEQELERCHRHGRVMALLMLDLDHFKAINDTHGHLFGDRVLLDFVARVDALLRKPDRFGRFGGEEFVILLPETNDDEAMVVADRIRAELEVPGELPTYTVSIGVTVSRSGDASVDALLARADIGLYRAKDKGRDRAELE